MSESTRADEFNPAQWRSSAAVERDNPRAGMVASLEAGKLHAGLSRAEVLALLGPPDAAELGRDTWNLGRAEFAPTYEYYVVRYDGEGRVAGFGMTRS